MAQLILLNGPPGCGKDTLAEYIARTYSFAHCKFARPIEYALRGFFELDIDDYSRRRNKDKDLAWPLLNGKTFRQVMQSFSEDWVKVQFGQNFFGRLAARRIRAFQHEGINQFVFSDCGFAAEVEVVANIFLPEEVTLIRLERLGCNYDNDTRGYIAAPPGCAFQILENDGTLEQLFAKTKEFIYDY